MNNSYLAKVDAFIKPFLGKNGYYLIKSEFVNEDSLWYLRLYIDLTEDEIIKRSACQDLTGDDNPYGTASIGTESLSGQDDIRTNPSEEDNADRIEEMTGGLGTEEDICPADDVAEDGFIPGIDISDCAKVSRYLSKWLDKEDFISETYTLEVCSKGFLKQPEQPDI